MAEISFANNTNATTSNETNSLIFFLKDVYSISGIFVAILSFISTTANGLLLLAIWKDPHRRFRTPSSIFVLGLTIADFLTGILVGPIIAYIRITFNVPVSNLHSSFQKAGQISSMVTMNTSYIILLLLTWNQFAAIRFPHKHRRLVTATKVKACVLSAWVYSLLFVSLFLWVEQDIIYQIDFYAHNCTFILFLTVAYFSLCVAFRKQTSRIVGTTSLSTSTANQLQNDQPVQHASLSRRRNTEKQFTIVAMMLVLFIIGCTLPATVVQIVYSYTENSTTGSQKSLTIAREISSVILFLKFALDPFLYCWRLSSYRRALRSIFNCESTRFLLEDPSASRSVRTRSLRHEIKNENDTAL